MSGLNKGVNGRQNADEIASLLANELKGAKPVPRKETREQLHRAGSWVMRKVNPVLPEKPLDRATKSLEELRLDDHTLDLELKRTLGRRIPCLLIAQLILMNVVFVFYAFEIVLQRSGTLSDTVLVAWLSSSIVGIIGLATVVTKYLFPESGAIWAREPESG